MTKPASKMSVDQSRRTLAAYLLSNSRDTYVHRPGSPEALFRGLRDQYGEADPSIDWEAAVTYWWDLARIGAVAMVAGPVGGSRDTYFLTDFGRSLLEHKDVSPHDRAGYLSAIRAVAGADTIAVGYADEAVGAWQAGLYRASAVMLGCACERLVLLVAEAVKDATGLAPYSDDLAKMLTPPKSGKKGPVAGISDIFGKVREAVEVVGGDEFDRLVSSVFDHARDLRNASGHPTGKVVTREDAQAGLLLFPGYHSRALDVIERIRTYKP